MITVLKFGGTSVSSPESRAMVIDKVRQTLENDSFPVVVVSAMGRKGEPYATDSLISLLEGDPPADARTLDLMMSCGEVISAAVLSQNLSRSGIPSVALTGLQAGITTDGVYGNAEVTSINPEDIKGWIAQGIVPIVTGFQGVFGKEITTLGRGGSDTVAVEIGCYLGANKVEIYTDVESVMVVDPRIVPQSKPIYQISYQHMLAAAENGSTIIHPRAVKAAEKCGIPLIIRSTFSQEYGTTIQHETEDLPLINLSYNREKEVLLILLGGDEAKVKFEERFRDYPRLKSKSDRTIYLKVLPTEKDELIYQIYQTFY